MCVALSLSSAAEFSLSFRHLVHIWKIRKTNQKISGKFTKRKKGWRGTLQTTITNKEKRETFLISVPQFHNVPRSFTVTRQTHTQTQIKKHMGMLNLKFCGVEKRERAREREKREKERQSSTTFGGPFAVTLLIFHPLAWSWFVRSPLRLSFRLLIRKSFVLRNRFAARAAKTTNKQTRIKQSKRRTWSRVKKSVLVLE